MRPILLSGHERALTQVKYSTFRKYSLFARVLTHGKDADGDIIFSVSKDHVVVGVFFEELCKGR